MVTPHGDRPLVVRLVHGDVGHEAGRGGAVPVLLTRLEEDPFAG
jgi:hypothetical protein